MKRLLLIAWVVFAANAYAEKATVEEIQAKIDRVKTFVSEVEGEIDRHVFIEPSSSAEETEFRRDIISALKYDIAEYRLPARTARSGKLLDMGMNITDKYLSAAVISGYLAVEQLAELYNLLTEADISKGLNDAKQVIPNIVATSSMQTHWVRARALLRIAVRNAK